MKNEALFITHGNMLTTLISRPSLFSTASTCGKRLQIALPPLLLSQPTFMHNGIGIFGAQDCQLQLFFSLPFFTILVA
jgi:hypothetical protein